MLRAQTTTSRTPILSRSPSGAYELVTLAVGQSSPADGGSTTPRRSIPSRRSLFCLIPRSVRTTNPPQKKVNIQILCAVVPRGRWHYDPAFAYYTVELRLHLDVQRSCSTFVTLLTLIQTHCTCIPLEHWLAVTATFRCQKCGLRRSSSVVSLSFCH